MSFLHNILIFLRQEGIALIIAIPILFAPILFVVNLFSWRRLSPFILSAITGGIFLVSLWLFISLEASIFPQGLQHYLFNHHLFHASSVLHYTFSNLRAPLGIVYHVDALSAFFLLLISFISFVISLSAPALLKDLSPQRRGLFYTLFLLCVTGYMGICVTGDIFNVFVFLEIASLSSYALVALNGERHKRAFEAAYNYLIVGSVGGGFILIGIGFFFIATGTLNMQDLSNLLKTTPYKTSEFIGFIFILIGLLLKMGTFFFNRFLSNLYLYSNAPSAAFLSSVVPKVMLYLLLRITFNLVGVAFFLHHPLFLTIIAIMSCLGILFGAFFACFELNLKRIFAYSSVSQVGYILLMFTIGTPLALCGAFLQIVAHALAKAALFLGAGIYEKQLGSTHLATLYLKAQNNPWVARSLFIVYLSILGFPFTLGFSAKWYFLEASLQSHHFVYFIIILLGSFLSMLYVARIIGILFGFFAPSPHKYRQDRVIPVIENIRLSSQVLKSSNTLPFLGIYLISILLIVLATQSHWLIAASQNATSVLFHPFGGHL